MKARLVSRKVFQVLAVIAVVFAAVLACAPTQAHAAANVARIEDRYGRVIGRYEDLQAAFDAVEDGQKIYLTKEVKVSKPLVINRGKLFELRLNGHTITNADHELPSYLMIVKNGHVVISGPGCMEGKYSTRCIRLDSGRLSTWASEKTFFRGSRVMDIYGGEAYIDGGTFENSIVVYNPAAKLEIRNGSFEKSANVSAKGENACDMKIMGGEFIGQVTNTGKTGFITGGTYHYLRMPNDKYIHPEYTKVEDSITRSGRTEKAYRIVRRPPSVALTPESGTAQYDPAGTGTTVSAKVADSDQTTELSGATFKWYQGDALLGEGQTMTLSDPGTYKAVATYKGKDYEATYEVKPADISSGYRLGFSKAATFTGFPFGKDFVNGGVQLFKEGSDTPIEGFTYEVVSCGENINAGTGAGTYTVKGIGNFTGELSGSFDIAMADFGAVAFAVRPTNPTYTGAPVQPAVTGTLTTGGRVYTLDASEYMVTYENNKNVGTGAATVTSREKNFSPDSTQREFTIGKAANDVSVSMEGWASGEAAKSPSVTASFDANKATFAYKAKGASDDTYTDVVPSKPGDYTVRATIPASDNYEAGVATADFTIAPMPLSIDTVTVAGRGYEKGNTAVGVTGVTFKNAKGEAVALEKGTDYTATGAMETDSAGQKGVTVTVTLANSDYSLAENTATTTVAIAKATPSSQKIRTVGYITYPDTGGTATQVTQSVAEVVPEDAGETVTYVPGEPVVPASVSVEDFGVSDAGVATATLRGVYDGAEVTLPVTVQTSNYTDMVIDVVVMSSLKTEMKVSLGAYDTSKTYGDGAFELTASVTNPTTGAEIETVDGNWYWYSSDPSVLSVPERGSNKAVVTVNGAGSAKVMAWYEPEGETVVGAAVTDAVTVGKRPLTVTVANQESIYVGGTLPGLPGGEAIKLDGLATDDHRSAVTLDYEPKPNNTKPGTYDIVASNVQINNAIGADVTANYDITYVNGTFEVKPKETQTITAEDVVATYGDADKSVSAVTDGDGAISYAVTSGSDCVGVDATSGALTIKKAGPATVTVTAAETATCAQTTKDVTVTVLKAESKAANVSDPDFGWTYDGTERRLVVVEGEVTGGTMRYSLDGKNFSPSIPTAKNAGDYTVWYKVVGDENHNDSKVQSLDVTVYQANPIVSSPGPLSATCGDLLEDVKLPKEENGTWSWGADPGAVVEHAGVNNFDATFTPTDETNYSKIEGVLVVVNADKGASSVTKDPAATNPDYNGGMQALVKAGTAAGGTMAYSLDGEDYVEELPAAVEVGNYKVWYMVTGDENHNDSEAKQVTSKISRADISKAKVELEQTSYVYDGKAKEPAAKVTLGGRELVAGTDYDVSYANNVNIGTATVTLTGKVNYKGTAKATFSIKEKSEPKPDPKPDPKPTPAPEKASMHRLYNPYSGEHFYTASDTERDALVEAGWSFEGEGWTAPKESSAPVYRLYNAYGGEHHYTMSADERDMLLSAGWNDEGIGWYSDDAETVPVFRDYNPNAFACNHSYTASAEEHDYLASLGWVYEGVAWYGI